MTIQRLNAAIPSCQIIIRGTDKGDFPDFAPVLVRATDSTIVVSCIPWSEGEIDLTVGSEGELDPKEPAAWTGRIATPRRLVRVVTVEGTTIVERPVAGTTAGVRIWTNHPLVPDRIVIELS